MSKTDMPARIYMSESDLLRVSDHSGLTPYVRAELVREAMEALEEAGAFVSREISAFLHGACVISKVDMEPVRESLDEEDLGHVEAMEGISTAVSAALSKLKEAGL